MRKIGSSLYVISLVLRQIRQRKPNKYFIVVFCSSASLFVLFVALLFLTDANIFAWLMHAALYATATISILGVIWDIINAVKQIKRENLPLD